MTRGKNKARSLPEASYFFVIKITKKCKQGNGNIKKAMIITKKASVTGTLE
ncbi:hypothetical protein [Serratia marcescens]|uniref:hypothetical protein n=1 Tax=Serratia marcescens TaxID=615 RepID=UPI0015F10CF2|nr:hypothetical protein [Serratia marcescens]